MIKLKRKMSIKKTKKKPELTRQTHDKSYETVITMYKASHNKL
jgi:hypothetical protein